jgi:hypothetical protein
MALDPYFIHYLLLVQEVKINSEIDEWNRVDMKSQFSKMIENYKVPLHEWTRWIENTLAALTGVKKNRSPLH